MNLRLIIILLSLFFLHLSAQALIQTNRFQPGMPQYDQQGVLEVIAEYENQQLIRGKLIFHQAAVEQTGMISREEFFTNQQRIVRIIKKYTDHFAMQSGYNQSIEYFNTNNQLSQTDLFIHPDIREMTGIVKRIIHYTDGRVGHVENYYTRDFGHSNGFSKDRGSYDQNGKIDWIEIYFSAPVIFHSGFDMLKVIFNDQPIPVNYQLYKNGKLSKEDTDPVALMVNSINLQNSYWKSFFSR